MLLNSVKKGVNCSIWLFICVLKGIVLNHRFFCLHSKNSNLLEGSLLEDVFKGTPIGMI